MTSIALSRRTNVDEISHLLQINSVNVLEVLIYYNLLLGTAVLRKNSFGLTGQVNIYIMRVFQ